MLYPEILNIKKGNKIKKSLILLSISISIILIVINICVDKKNHWSLLCILGIIYVWVTVLYAMDKNVNIASHVLLQTIAISCMIIRN